MGMYGSISASLHTHLNLCVYIQWAVNSIVLCRSQTAASGILFDIGWGGGKNHHTKRVHVDQPAPVILHRLQAAVVNVDMCCARLSGEMCVSEKCFSKGSFISAELLSHKSATVEMKYLHLRNIM